MKQSGIQPSMSRCGNCYDNAPMEGFWGSLKNELVRQQPYASRADAQTAIQQYSNILKAPITTSGFNHASAMFRLRCSLKNSANIHGWLGTRVSAIDSIRLTNLCVECLVAAA